MYLWPVPHPTVSVIHFHGIYVCNYHCTYVCVYVCIYARLYVHATYKMPYGPHGSNKPPYPPRSMVFIMAIKKQNIFTWLREIHWHFKRIRNFTYFVLMTLRCFLITIRNERDSIHRKHLCPHIALCLKKHVPTHTHARTHTHAHARVSVRVRARVCVCVWIALMRATNYAVSH